MMVLVEETEDRDAEPMLVHAAGTDFMGGAYTYEVQSTRVLGHRAWRCSLCKKMAVGGSTATAPRECGFCKGGA